MLFSILLLFLWLTIQQPALLDHHTISPFLDLPVTSHLMFFNRAISINTPCLWNDLHVHVAYHLNSELLLYLHHRHFFTPTTVIANRKTSSSSGSSIRHPRAFHSKLKCHLFKPSYPDPSDHPLSSSERHPCTLTAILSPPGILEIGPEILLTPLWKVPILYVAALVNKLVPCCA